jgi:hypothetical protein
MGRKIERGHLFAGSSPAFGKRKAPVEGAFYFTIYELSIFSTIYGH